MSKKILGRLKRKPTDDSATSESAPVRQFTEHPAKIKRSLNVGRRVAVQFDDSTVCLAAASSYGLKSTLTALKQVRIPSEMATEELRDEFISQVVSKFVHQHGGRRAEICIALSGREVTFRTFSMPAISASELKSAIAFEAKKQVPFPIDECFYDYRRVARVQTAERERDTIALQAATRRYIKQLIEPFRKLELHVSQAQFAQEAIGPLLTTLPGFRADLAQAVITLADNRSEISFFRGAQLEFHRSGSAGSAGLGDEPDDYRLEMFVDALASEVQTSFDFYSGQYGRQLSNRIYLLGRAPSADKIAALLTRAVGSEFVPLPVAELPFLSKQHGFKSEDLLCCIGAVAVATGNTVFGNLVPDREKQVNVQHRHLVRMRAATIILAASLAFSWWFINEDVHISRTELNQLEGQLTYLKGTEAYVTYQVLKRQVAASQAYVDQAKETPSHFYLNLKELSQLTPDNVRLNRLILDSQAPVHGLTLEGTIVSGEVPPELTLAEYVEQLAASPFYRDVKIERHVKRRQKQGFEIDFTLAMAGGI